MCNLCPRTMCHLSRRIIPTIDSFKVTASYALGGWGGGQDGLRMNWLYEAFAKEVVKAFTGEEKKA